MRRVHKTMRLNNGVSGKGTGSSNGHVTGQSRLPSVDRTIGGAERFVIMKRPSYGSNRGRRTTVCEKWSQYGFTRATYEWRTERTF